jgi:N6-adenosine-specific RNA methylase IME4
MSKDTASGRVTGSREPSPSSTGLGPSGFDPARFGVIVVDPPWAYGSDTGRPNRTAEAHYRTIGANGKEINRRTGEGIQAIIESAPVAEWADAKSHLYLWATNPKLPFAFSVMSAWGFDYKTTLTWVKTRADGGVSGGGMGWFFRGATEHVLFGTRGGVILAPATIHSAKPAAFYELLDGIYGPEMRKLDVFARRHREGWQSYGDELEAAA